MNVSIIVPVLYVLDYVDRCFNSVMALYTRTFISFFTKKKLVWQKNKNQSYMYNSRVLCH